MSTPNNVTSHKGLVAIGSQSTALAVGETYAPALKGFHCNTTGTIQVTMADGTTPYFYVVAGSGYGYSIQNILSLGTAVLYGLK